MVKKGKNFCTDCGMPSVYHVQTWLEELVNRSLPRLSLPRKLGQLLDFLLEKFFTFLKLASLRSDFTRSHILLRSTCFIEEARGRGVKFKALRGPYGYTNHFRAEINGKNFRFEKLPIADFANSRVAELADDKERAKTHLKKGNFPIADGESFWFWQKKEAIEFGKNKIGFPLVVKPRGGSLSKHVTTAIQDPGRLSDAIDKAITYSPTFIVERFIPNAFVHRATVVDFDFVACVKQVPANVAGDGASTIRALIDGKNRGPGRGERHQKEFTLYKIVENETTEELLRKKGYDFSSVPGEGEVVYLQKDPFLRLGGDLIELTPQIHSDNVKLFRNVAKFFDIRVVGVDFLCQNIATSWKNQQCAILELNSVPCIELHHFPSSGDPQNVARALTDLFFKYYL